MVHLAISVRMHQLHNHGLMPAFVLGSIAPDAIHMRPNISGDDKRRTHLLVDPPDSDDHRRVRELLVRYWAEGSEVTQFVEGYAAHLLADRIWVKTLMRAFGAHFPQSMPDEELQALYYQETDWIDLDLYRRMLWREEVWAQLAAAEPMDFQPFLTAEEIGQWRDRTLGWYDTCKHESMRTPVFLSSSEVEVFASEAAQTIAGHFRAWKANLAERLQ
jgi:hypothetical protein